MNGSSVPQHCAVVEAGSLSSECPSSEWEFMQTWMSLSQHPVPRSFTHKSSMLAELTGLPGSVQLTGRFSTRQFLFTPYDFDTKFFSVESSISSTQQSVIADALTSTGSIWWAAVIESGQKSRHGATLKDQQKAVHTIANDYYQPYSSVFCLHDVIEGPNDQRNIAVPISPEWKPELLSNVTASISGYPAVEFPSIQRAQLLEIPGRESDNRVKWIQLSQNPLTHASIGLVVLLPKDPPTVPMAIKNNADIVVCNIQAGWGASSIKITSNQEGSSSTSSLVNFDTSIGSVFDSSPNSMNRFEATDETTVYFNRQPAYPSIPIEIDVEWAKYLNPFVPSVNTTVIDFLLKSVAANGSKSDYPEYPSQDIVTALLTNGLARSGFTSELQGNISLSKTQINTAGVSGDGINKSTQGIDNSTQGLDGNLWVSGKRDFFTVDPEQSKDWVKLRVDTTIQGYAYNIDGPAPKVAIAFLLTYCCLALGHCFYNGISDEKPVKLD
ncbi:hypothetical protein MMC22_005575 [Lobaria immixta]|nr:hypothetical protein [Lobaria immixta]